MSAKMKPIGNFVLDEGSYDCSHLFENKTVYLDKLSGFDMGSVTDMSFMFKNSFITVSEDFDEDEVFSLSTVLNVEEVMNASNMFDGAEFGSSVNIDLNFLRVEYADSLFSMISIREPISIDLFVPNVIRFSNTFFGVYLPLGCKISIKGLAPYSCISGMFRKANIPKSSITYLDTSRVMDAERMFNEAYFDKGAELPESMVFNSSCDINNIFKEAYFLEGFVIRRDMFMGKLLSSYFTNALYGNKDVISKNGLFNVDFIV